MQLELYGNRESGHSYKVRLFLALADLPHRYHRVDLRLPRAERPADFRAVSPFGEVPVLIHDGRPLAQSNAILLHLARETGRFGPPSPATWDELTMWLFWEANRIGLSLPNLRLHTRFVPAPPDVLAMFAARVQADLATLDERLRARPYLVGDAASVADLSCCGYLGLADQAGLDLASWPRVRAWLDRLAQLPGYAPNYALMDRA